MLLRELIKVRDTVRAFYYANTHCPDFSINVFAILADESLAAVCYHFERMSVRLFVDILTVLLLRIGRSYNTTVRLFRTGRRSCRLLECAIFYRTRRRDVGHVGMEVVRFAFSHVAQTLYYL